MNERGCRRQKYVSIDFTFLIESRPVSLRIELAYMDIAAKLLGIDNNTNNRCAQTLSERKRSHFEFESKLFIALGATVPH